MISVGSSSFVLMMRCCNVLEPSIEMSYIGKQNGIQLNV